MTDKRLRSLVAATAAAAGIAAALTAAAPAATAADPPPDRIYYNAPEQPGRPAAVRYAEFTPDSGSYRDVPGGKVGEFRQDGSRITYPHTVQGPTGPLNEIQVAAPDGSGVTTVSTPDPATQDDTAPHWWLNGSVLFNRKTVTGSTAKFQVWAVDADGSNQRLVLDDMVLYAVNPKTGDVITTSNAPAVLRKYDAASGTFGAAQPLPYEITSGLHEGVAFSPDGGKLAVTDYGRLYVAASDGSALREVYGGQCVNVREFAWSPAGDRLAVQLTGTGTGLSIVDLLGNVVRHDSVWLGEQGVAGPFFWQPNGQVPAASPPPPAPAVTPAPTAFAAEPPLVVPSTSYLAEGKCQAVFARSAADGSIWAQWNRGFNGTTTPWTRIGDASLDVAVHRIEEGGLVMVVRNAADKSVWATRDGALPGQWLPWQRIGGAAEDVHLMGFQPLKQPLSVLVLARDPNTHAINSLRLPSGWSGSVPTTPWEEFGGPAAEVDVAVNPAGGFAVVARGPGDGSVFARRANEAGLQPWIKIGGPARSTTMANGAEGPVVTAQNPVDGSLWTTVSLTENARWQKIGDPAYDAVAMSGHNGNFGVVARNVVDKSLWITPYNHSANGQWTPQPWLALGFPSATLPGVLANPNGGALVATVAADGKLQVRYCDGQWRCN